MTPETIRRLLCPPPIVSYADAAAWWSAHEARTRDLPRTIERAFAAGIDADRLAWPFAGGYAAALRSLIPSLSQGTLAAFAVTEAGGNHPKAIETTIRERGDRYVVDGHKRWVTLGPNGGTFLVVAKEEGDSTRPSLKVAMIPSAHPGVKLLPLSDLPFVPEIPHAELILEGVEIEAEAVLPGDGYDRYVKPFRTVEDLHVFAAIGGHLLATGSRNEWSRDWRERLLIALIAIDGLAELDPRAAETHVALAGLLGDVSALITECDPWWSGEAKDRWQRDRVLFKVASTARARRRERAWEKLTTSGQ
jgi:acyl-CoA dehydrogenase